METSVFTMAQHPNIPTGPPTMTPSNGGWTPESWGAKTSKWQTWSKLIQSRIWWCDDACIFLNKGLKKSLLLSYTLVISSCCNFYVVIFRLTLIESMKPRETVCTSEGSRVFTTVIATPQLGRPSHCDDGKMVLPAISQQMSRLDPCFMMLPKTLRAENFHLNFMDTKWWFSFLLQIQNRLLNTHWSQPLPQNLGGSTCGVLLLHLAIVTQA